MRTTASGRAAGAPRVAVSSFVGRRAEVAEVRRRLGESRLVTLTGAGGVGKTRLAVEVAGASRRAFDGGVTLVDLSAVRDGGQVPQAVADALDLVDPSTRPPLDKVADHLAGRRALLVLDNCEHVHQASAAFAVELLGRVRDVRVLATSRRSLGVDGEHLFPVPPLSLPDPDLLPELPDPESLVRYDAVRLLVDRARALLPDFALTAGNRLAAARLCAALDGIPLAIELAAARLRVLSLEHLAERLGGPADERFTLLTTGSALARSRQQTLRGLVDWSHGLCTDGERSLWARLSVFVGGFDLDAATAVCGGDGQAPAEILDLLDRLVAQSIVIADPGVWRTRFRLLETIREYGWQRLAEAGGTGRLRARHRDHYLRLARATHDRWCGPDQAAQLALLREEQGNLRAALEFSAGDPGDPGDPEGATATLDLVVALRNHWTVGGFLAEGRYWLDRALDVPDDPPGRRLPALGVAAVVALQQGDTGAARRRLAECDRLAASIGSPTTAARSHILRGTAALATGDLHGAVRLFDRAIAGCRAIGLTEEHLLAAFQLTMALAHAGELSRAAAVGREALDLSRSLDERLSRSYLLWALAFTQWRDGDPGGAARRTRDALTLQREFHNPTGVALMVELLAWVTPDPGRAARLLGAAAAVWDGLGTGVAAFGPHLARHHDQCEQRVRQALGPAAARALEHGRRATIAETISLALDTGERSGQAGAQQQQERDRLTRREREVARLVAQGMTNRAIAARLTISPRTVEGHVEQILAKLGFDSRTQVAAWAAAPAGR
jgi:predicted ATPase/DNA-binding CsgD family transcriptional regulator